VGGRTRRRARASRACRRTQAADGRGDVRHAPSARLRRGRLARALRGRVLDRGRAMSRRKKKPNRRGERVGGNSPNPEARARSLANLKRGETRAPFGNTRGMTHGFTSAALVRDVEREVRELMDVLAEAAPVRDPDGSLPAADMVAVETAA